MSFGFGFGFPKNYVAALFTPAQLFTTGVNGAWYDPSDLTTLFRDAAGTLPVTAVEQPVGLMLDKSKGLVLGSETIPQPFDLTASPWITLGELASISTNSFANTSGAGAGRAINSLFSSGKTYLVSCAYTKTNSSVTFSIGTDAGATVVSSTNNSGILNRVFINATPQLYLRLSGNDTLTITSLSVRELTGNHAFNSSGNSANFPVLSARYNLLTETEFRNGLSDLTTSGGLISSTTLAGYLGAIAFGKDGSTITSAYKYFTHTSGVSYTLSVIVQMTDGLPPAFSGIASSSSNPFVLVGNGQLSSNTAEYVVSNISGSLYRVSWTYVASGSVGNTGVLAYATNNNRTFKVTAYDLRVANDALNQPAYQRVNTATDYDTVGFKPYLKFNGTNQWLQTNSIDFTYGDKMFVSAGVRKLSDAATGTLMSTSDTANGSFELFAPINTAATYQFRSRGSLTASTDTGPTFLAPTTNIISGIGNISGDQAILRVNGTQAAISTLDQGTGNYSNLPLYIGARAGTSLWFNGRLYGMVVAGKQASADEVDKTEDYLALKTGFSYPSLSGIPTFTAVV